MGRTSLRLIAAVAGLLLGGGCGTGGELPVSTRVTTLAPRAAEPSAQVLAALADGVVTAEEMASAYSQSVRCLETGGAVGHFAFDLDIGPTMVLEIGVVGDGPEGQLTDRLMFFCDQRHIGDMSGVYAAANPVTNDHRRRGAEAMRACLLDAGIEAEGSLAELRTQLQELLFSGNLDVATTIAASECQSVGDSGVWRQLGS